MDDGLTLTLIVAASLGATLFLSLPTYVVLHRLGVMDLPNHRSSHRRPTIRGGGVACWAGIVVVALIALAFGVSIPAWSLLAASLLAGLGFADDLHPLPAVGRLGAQVAVGASLGLVLGGAELAALGALAVPVAVNAVNFMDGINGITALTVAAWATVVLFAATTGVTATALLAALCLGSALGFLPWNAFRARMFLGDSGSYLFGALIAATVLQSAADGGSPWLVLAPMTVYLFDTGYTLLRRILRSEPLMVAHRDHIYQHLVATQNWSHLAVAAIVASLTLFIGLAWSSLMVIVAMPLTLAGLLGYRALTHRPSSPAELERSAT